MKKKRASLLLACFTFATKVNVVPLWLFVAPYSRRVRLWRRSSSSKAFGGGFTSSRSCASAAAPSDGGPSASVRHRGVRLRAATSLAFGCAASARTSRSAHDAPANAFCPAYVHSEAGNGSAWKLVRHLREAQEPPQRHGTGALSPSPDSRHSSRHRVTAGPTIVAVAAKPISISGSSRPRPRVQSEAIIGAALALVQQVRTARGCAWFDNDSAPRRNEREGRRSGAHGDVPDLRRDETRDEHTHRELLRAKAVLTLRGADHDHEANHSLGDPRAVLKRTLWRESLAPVS